MRSISPRLAAMLALPAFAAALNITVYQHNVSLVPSPLPPSHAHSDGEEIISLFQNLGRTTNWTSVANVTFQGDTYEPEGMIRLASDSLERYIVSAGEYTAPTVKYPAPINGTDRSAGAGFAHLIVFDGNGTRIADATLTPEGAIEYHNGGIDFDGQHIWATIAQYRPNSTAHVARINPHTLVPETVLHIKDHEGGIVHDTETNNIWTLNWGSRNESLFNLNHLPHNVADPGVFTQPTEVVRNPSYFIDYQDCKFLSSCSRHYGGRPVMLCSGVATLSIILANNTLTKFNLGGIALVDVETMTPLAEVPITMTSEQGVPVTQNPVDVSVVDGKLRMYWLPDQHNSTLYVYEAQPESAFEFGGSGGEFGGSSGFQWPH